MSGTLTEQNFTPSLTTQRYRSPGERHVDPWPCPQNAYTLTSSLQRDKLILSCRSRLLQCRRTYAAACSSCASQQVVPARLGGGAVKRGVHPPALVPEQPVRHYVFRPRLTGSRRMRSQRLTRRVSACTARMCAGSSASCLNSSVQGFYGIFPVFVIPSQGSHAVKGHILRGQGRSQAADFSAAYLDSLDCIGCLRISKW